MLDCIEKPDRWNKILNLGGPDEGLTMKQQGEMLFEVSYPHLISLSALHC